MKKILAPGAFHCLTSVYLIGDILKKNILFLTFFCLIFPPFISSAESPQENPISLLLFEPDESINVFESALIATKQFYLDVYGKEIDAASYKNKAQSWANELISGGDKFDNAKDVVRKINKKLYGEIGFVYGDAGLRAESPEVFLMSDVIDKRSGDCIALSILYQEIAMRLGYRLDGFRAPMHCSLFYKTDRESFVVEPSNKGAIFDSLEDYLKSLPHAAESKSYARQITKKEMLAGYLSSIANLYRKNGDLDKAQDILESVLKVDPGSAEAWSDLGSVDLERGRLNEAITHYKMALSYLPEEPAIHFNLGRVYFKLKNWSDADKSFAVAIKYDPTLADAYYSLGLIRSEQGRFQDALPFYRKALEQNGRDYHALNASGTAYLMLGQLSTAMNFYNQAIKIKPEYAEAISNLGLCYDRLNDFVTEAEYHKKALAIDPAYADAAGRLGGAYANQGDLENAKKYTQMAIRLNPSLPEAWFAMGLLYGRQGDENKAEEALRKTLELNPEHKQARAFMDKIRASKSSR